LEGKLHRRVEDFEKEGEIGRNGQGEEGKFLRSREPAELGGIMKSFCRLDPVKGKNAG